LKIKIVYLEGEVKIQRAGATQMVMAKVGDILTEGDKISTSAKSVCDLEFAPQTISRLSSDADLTITQAAIETKKGLFKKSENKNINLNLAKGALLSKVKKLGEKESFKVSTPSAVAGVRGTFFKVANTANLTKVDVISGVVAVTNLISNTISTVTAGQSLSISKENGELQSSEMEQSELSDFSELSGESDSDFDIDADFEDSDMFFDFDWDTLFENNKAPVIIHFHK